MKDSALPVLFVQGLTMAALLHTLVKQGTCSMLMGSFSCFYAGLIMLLMQQFW